MSTRRRSGTVVNITTGEGIIHEEGEGTCQLYVGGVTGGDRSAHARLCDRRLY